jgi:hypothetical protein
MNYGAIILDQFDPAHLPALHEALVETAEDYELPADALTVSYAADSALGDALVLKLEGKRDGDDQPIDIYRKARELRPSFGPGAFGTSLSGYFSDRTPDEVLAPKAYTAYHRESRGDWVVEHGVLYTHEGRTEGPAATALVELADDLDVDSAEFLLDKLTSADVGPFPIVDPPPGDLAEQLEELRF